MKKRKILSSIFGSMALASGSIWFGAYVARLMTTYQMFEPAETTLKSYISNNNLPAVIQTIFPLVNLTFFFYLVMITAFTIFIILTELKFKENGWLLIITMIIYLTLPFEFVHLTIDYKLVIYFLNGQFTSGEILKLIIERLTILSSFPIILILCYFTIPFFLVFKPFTLYSENEN